MKKFIQIGIVAILFCNLLPMAAAESALDPAIKQEIEDKLSKASFGECEEVLVPAFDLEMVDFLAFLDQNFLNKSANTTLLNTAAARYRELRDALDEKFEKLKPKSEAYSLLEADQYQEALEEFLDCGEILATYKDLAKTHMINHIKSNTYQKKTLILLEKYQAINLRVRELHFALAQMYAYFLTFRNKLPAFSDCVTN